VADSYDTMNDLMSGGLHRYWKDTLLDMSLVKSMVQAIRRQQQQQQQHAFPIDDDSTGTTQDDNYDCPQLRILDVAGGTGDVAFRFVEASNVHHYQEQAWSGEFPPLSVTVCDINKEMLRVGEARARERFGATILSESDTTGPPLSFVEGNAQSLDFPDNTFDLYTIAFGLRNVTDVVSYD
jgi:ubiquinone/menaquinone biosynthesis C-methylase UbiE